MANKTGKPKRNNAMNVSFTDTEVRPEAANAQAVQVARQTDGDTEVSTSQRLFGEITPESLRDENIPAPGQSVPLSQNPLEETGPEEEVPAPEPEKPEEDPKPTPPAVEGNDPAPDEFIDLEKLQGKKIRQKVDGKEVFTTIEELQKYRNQDQIKKHLAEEADKVGEERRRNAEERRQLQEMRQQRAAFENPAPQGNFEQPSMPPQYDPVLARLQALEQRVQQTESSTAPVIYQSNRMDLDQSLRARGFNDFNDYWPQIVANVSPQLIQEVGGNEFRAAELTYFQLKAQELNQGIRPQAAPRPQPIAQAPQRPPVTRVDSGTQPSSGINDDGPSQYRQDFRRAVNSNGDKEAWNKILTQKGLI